MSQFARIDRIIVFAYTRMGILRRGRLVVLFQAWQCGFRRDRGFQITIIFSSRVGRFTICTRYKAWCSVAQMSIIPKIFTSFRVHSSKATVYVGISTSPISSTRTTAVDSRNNHMFSRHALVFVKRRWTIKAKVRRRLINVCFGLFTFGHFWCGRGRFDRLFSSVLNVFCNRIDKISG